MQITGPNFCAGLVIINNIAVRAAPIIHYMQGWTVQRVVAYAHKRGWSIEYV